MNGVLAVHGQAVERMRTPVVGQQCRVKIEAALGKGAEQILWYQCWKREADQHIGLGLRQLAGECAPIIGPAKFDQPCRRVADIAFEQQSSSQPSAKIADAEMFLALADSRHHNRVDQMACFKPS